jgi:hypothetical protein
LEPVIDAMNGARSPLLPGYHVKILDGNHLAGTEYRSQQIRIGNSTRPLQVVWNLRFATSP